jgi:hypothetical protein
MWLSNGSLKQTQQHKHPTDQFTEASDAPPSSYEVHGRLRRLQAAIHNQLWPDSAAA